MKNRPTVIFSRHIPATAAYIDWPNFDKNVMAMDVFPSLFLALMLKPRRRK